MLVQLGRWFLIRPLLVSPGDTLNFEVTDLAHNSATIPNMTPAGSDGWKGLMNESFSVKLETEGIYVPM